MYPQVFADFAEAAARVSDVSVLPTPAFFYGLSTGRGDHGRHRGGQDAHHPPRQRRRTGQGRAARGQLRVERHGARSVHPRQERRAEGEDAAEGGSRRSAAGRGADPGLIAALSRRVGAKVAKGDKLLMMEAMKMQTTVYAPADGVVAELHAAVGETVEAKDLIVRLRG